MVELGTFGAIAGGIAAIVAGVLLAAFFATGRDAIGRANDAASAIMALLLIPAALAVGDIYDDKGIAIVAVTIVGVGAMIETAIASALTAAGRLSIAQLVVWQGGGFIVMFLWMLGVSLAALAWGRLPVAFGWLGVVAAILVIVATGSIGSLVRRPGGIEALGDMRRPPMVPVITFLAAFVCFPVWCIWLGLSLP